jgi:hypothetical protein
MRYNLIKIKDVLNTPSSLLKIFREKGKVLVTDKAILTVEKEVIPTLILGHLSNFDISADKKYLTGEIMYYKSFNVPEIKLKLAHLALNGIKPLSYCAVGTRNKHGFKIKKIELFQINPETYVVQNP